MSTASIFVLILSITLISGAPPQPTAGIQNDINSIKSSLRVLSNEIEVVRRFYLDNLEPKVSKAVTSLAGIDTNINHLNFKSHVWDSFQHYVTSWNDQISTLDRKLDIISEGQSRLSNLEFKIDSFSQSDVDYRLTNLETKLSDLKSGLDDLSFKLDAPKQLSLFSEFATRGILTTLKNIERKIDREDGKNSKDLRNDLLNDVASKVDVIFDKLAKDTDESLEEEGGKDNKKFLDGFVKKLEDLERNTEDVIVGQKDIKKLIQTGYIESYFSQQRSYIEDLFKNSQICSNQTDTNQVELCEDFPSHGKNNICTTRNDLVWTVIQRRDLYPTQQNFNLSWDNYKQGFGNRSESFWIGNEHLHRFGKLSLRIELEDFAGNFAWAQYKLFQVGDETEQFKLTVRGYSGNATDSLTLIHNGSLFSTVDRKNDLAPDCCPCAVTYGGGWWYNSCFEANLNGIYLDSQVADEYYRGIIWEKWLGNYSLKKTTMMVRKFEEEGLVEEETTPDIPSEIPAEIDSHISDTGFFDVEDP